MNKFRVFNTMAFVVFCLSIGQVATILLTTLFYDLNSIQIFEALRDPLHSNKSVIMFLSFSYTLLSFFLIPITYILLYNKRSLAYLWTNNKIRFIPLLLSMVLVVSIMPLITTLIELNHSIELPNWLPELELYLKQSEERAGELTNSMLSFGGINDLIITILIMAIIPGLLEEFFFRGLVQRQLMEILKNQHAAVWLSAFLFSFFHFQFYGLIPRMILGSLFGYIFVWSNNIWYPCVAHVTNNLIGVLAGYFLGPKILTTEDGTMDSMALLFLSFISTFLILLYLKRIEAARLLIKPN